MRLYDIESKFTTGEFMCPCGCGFGRNESDIDPNLITKLNVVRMLYGHPMVVTSGARCLDYNTEIDGAKNSAHLPHTVTGQCRAADILTRRGDKFRLMALAFHVGFTRIGDAENFLHLDVAWDLPQNIIFTY